RERELQFRTLIESAPDAVIVINETGRIELTNAETQRLFGYPREALIGQPVEMLIPERFRHGHVAHRAGYAAAPRTRPMGAGLDLWGRRIDGTEFPFATSFSPLNVGERKLVFCDIRDVTEQAVTKRQIQ